MANKKNFYAVIAEVRNGTHFDEDECTSYCEDKNLAETEFEKVKGDIIGVFEDCYENVITNRYMSDGERLCRITAKDGDDSDCCVIRMRELKMICR